MQIADSKGSAGTADDSGQNDQDLFVSQHSRKPPVVCSQSPSDNITIYQNGVLVIDKGIPTYNLVSKSLEAILGEPC